MQAANQLDLLRRSLETAQPYPSNYPKPSPAVALGSAAPYPVRDRNRYHHWGRRPMEADKENADNG